MRYARNQNRSHWQLFFAAIAAMGIVSESAHAQSALLLESGREKRDAERRDGWIIEKGDGAFKHTRRLEIHPRATPMPSLKYRLIPDEFDRIDGNSALYYLKAMGFLEESYGREMANKFIREQAKRAEEAGQRDHPPYTWQKMNPRELPVEEVKSFLKYVSFQAPLLREATLRSRFSLDRNIRDVESPIEYLLPEINSMRELARYQSMRARLAIAESRIEEAIGYIGQNLAMAEHLSQDEFFVTNLVGIAISGIAWDDMMYLLEHPETPNLYWSVAALPRPLVTLRHALAYERQLIFEQFKELRDVGVEPRTKGYWRDFVSQVIKKADSLELMWEQKWGLSDLDPDAARTFVERKIDSAYPAAKAYLQDDIQLEPGLVNAYPKAQVVFLAMKFFSERARDEHLKWQLIPYQLASNNELREKSFRQFEADAARLGWIAEPIKLLLPAMQAISSAVQRTDQRLALFQTVEAIRAYAAENDRTLPESLDQLALPAMPDPTTQRPFSYKRVGQQATLSGKVAGNIRHVLILTIKNEN